MTNKSQFQKQFSKIILTVIFTTMMSAQSEAAIQYVRWTGSQDKNAGIEQVLQTVNLKLGLSLTKDDFLLLEDRYLASSKFKMYVQTAGGIPVKSASIRTWVNSKTGEAIQVEAYVEDTQPASDTILARGRENIFKTLMPLGARKKAMSTVRKAVLAYSDDSQIKSMSATDFWENGELVRSVKVTSRRGTHQFTVSLATSKILKHVYNEFPQADLKTANNSENEFSVPAKIFPFYEETESGKLQKPIDSELKYLKRTFTSVDSDPYDLLKQRKYTESTYDALLGMTVQGQAKGYWSTSALRLQGQQILKTLPRAENSFDNGGVVLEGRYATVSIHPEAAKKFEGVNFQLTPSAQVRLDWVLGQTGWEVIPRAGLIGKRLASPMDAYNRISQKDANNDAVKYLNEGFDEVQVYYGVTKFMESLQSLGFKDPELSTRPFNAFLYDPDISYRDNAYYTDDTINFTTYSPGSDNAARDNGTIWHELGHGIMDRLMGDYVQLADTGGLSEGMADYLAALVIADVSGGKSFEGSDEFRIINRIGFNLTNEVHDDGEAYGGAMKDLLDAAMAKEGQIGLHKVTDLTLEAMRLTRNHPELTANGWFEHMLFADELGRPGLREPGEMKNLIVNALNSRNFSLTGDQGLADLSLKNEEQEILAGLPGSRQRPVGVSIQENEIATYNLKVKLEDGDAYKFQYPVKVVVEQLKSPLQGAIHWVGEESNPKIYAINGPNQELPVSLSITGKCDFANREDGSCVDYVHVLIYNNGSSEKPVAKKRFYLRLKTKEAAETILVSNPKK